MHERREMGDQKKRERGLSFFFFFLDRGRGGVGGLRKYGGIVRCQAGQAVEHVGRNLVHVCKARRIDLATRF